MQDDKIVVDHCQSKGFLVRVRMTGQQRLGGRLRSWVQPERRTPRAGRTSPEAAPPQTSGGRWSSDAVRDQLPASHM